MIEAETQIKNATGMANLHVPANLDFSAAIRDFTLASLKNVGGFEETWAYRMQLVVDELFMNAVRYGSGPDSSVDLSFDFAPHRVMVSVEDAGEGETTIRARDLSERIALARRLHEDRLRTGTANFSVTGRGLSQLVAAWADEVRFTDSSAGGIRVTITKTI